MSSGGSRAPKARKSRNSNDILDSFWEKAKKNEASLPELKKYDKSEEIKEPADLLWLPNEIDEELLDKFLLIVNIFSLNEDEALELLAKCDYQVDDAKVSQSLAKDALNTDNRLTLDDQAEFERTLYLEQRLGDVRQCFPHEKLGKLQEHLYNKVSEQNNSAKDYFSQFLCSPNSEKDSDEFLSNLFSTDSVKSGGFNFDQRTLKSYMEWILHPDNQKDFNYINVDRIPALMSMKMLQDMVKRQTQSTLQQLDLNINLKEKSIKQHSKFLEYCKMYSARAKETAKRDKEHGVSWTLHEIIILVEWIKRHTTRIDSLGSFEFGQIALFLRTKKEEEVKDFIHKHRDLINTLNFSKKKRAEKGAILFDYFIGQAQSKKDRNRKEKKNHKESNENIVTESKTCQISNENIETESETCQKSIQTNDKFKKFVEKSPIRLHSQSKGVTYAETTFDFDDIPNYGDSLDFETFASLSDDDDDFFLSDNSSTESQLPQTTSLSINVELQNLSSQKSTEQPSSLPPMSSSQPDNKVCPVTPQEKIISFELPNPPSPTKEKTEEDTDKSPTFVIKPVVHWLTPDGLENFHLKSNQSNNSSCSIGQKNKQKTSSAASNVKKGVSYRKSLLSKSTFQSLAAISPGIGKLHAKLNSSGPDSISAAELTSQTKEIANQLNNDVMQNVSELYARQAFKQR